MNTKVLTKCLEELSKETPNIEKVIGMLETIIEMSNSTPFYPQMSPVTSTPQPSQIVLNTGPNGEQAIIPMESGSGLIDAYLNGPIGKI